MTLRRILPVLTLAGALGLCQLAMAQDAAGPTLADLGKDQALTAAFDKMAEGHPMPEWLRTEAVTTPAQRSRSTARTTWR